MLRALSILFFIAGAFEIVLIIIGKLNLSAGLVAISFALFFGGVFHGLFEIERDLHIIKSRNSSSDTLKSTD